VTVTPPPTSDAADLPRRLTREQCAQWARQAMHAKTLSGAIMQVMSTASSPHGDAAQLRSLISRDPVLSARVLQAANSAAYATGRGLITRSTLSAGSFVRARR
jgi:HD-like signal output (HDOD) protein